MKDQLTLAIDALQAVRFIRETHGGSSLAAARIQDVAEMLAIRDDGVGLHGGICMNVAEAILNAYGGNISRLTDADALKRDAQCVDVGF